MDFSRNIYEGMLQILSLLLSIVEEELWLFYSEYAHNALQSVAEEEKCDAFIIRSRFLDLYIY